MQEVEFRLRNDRLTHKGAERPLTGQDWDRFAGWTKAYHDLAWRPGNDDALLALGRDIHTWLDGNDHWLAALRGAADGPVIADFAVQNAPTEPDRRFLEVPWELAATGDTWLAADPAMMWAPLRRIGATAAPPSPDSTLRLGVMFMAAAPRGETTLNFEAEEVAILNATARTGLDLFVEDSGSLDDMAQAWDEADRLQALHLSCHGGGGETPTLALEGPGGELDRVGVGKLAGSFALHKPRLLFVSACHTGQGDATVDPLARGLVAAGFPSVLGWADAVNDHDASAFAAAFYAAAALPRARIEGAWALARYELLRDRPHHRPPAHWHLARLFLGPHGGGMLAGGRKPRLRQDADAGRKRVIAARGSEAGIEVASRFEFVGRRRQIQAIQHEFRQPSRAGVLVHGFGGQGKSSLAARIIDRNPHLTPVVLFGTCDGPSILAAIREAVGAPAAAICDRYRDRVDPDRLDSYDPQALRDALRELLEGPCFHAEDGKPILLLLDNFEDLLIPPSGAADPWCVRPDTREALTAVIRAFAPAGGESRLLLTCRIAFALDHRGRDLAADLLAVPLPDMSEAEAQKQARHKAWAAGWLGDAELPPAFAALVPRVLAAARGNARLLGLLLKTALADPGLAQASVAALEAYLRAGGALPEEGELRATLEGLAIEKLLDPLTADERRLLRASTLFRLPVPLAVWRGYAASAGLERPDRLLGFGLWERLPDIADWHAEAVAPNAIAAARLVDNDSLSEQKIEKDILPALFTAWGGTDRSKTPYATDIELTRLALNCGNLDVLVATAEYAIRGQEAAFAYRDAAATAEQALAALVAGGRSQSADLLRAAAEAFDHVGDATALRRVYEAGPSLGTDDPALPNDERVARAQFRLRFAGWLVQQGEPDRALAELRATQAVLEALGDRRSRAVTLGDIARIMTAKGDVDQALELHRQQVQIFEALGDRRSRAVTLGDIARIMTAKGDVDQALELHREEMQTYEALGDRRSRAVTLGDIARIMTDKGDVDQALELHRERLQTYEALGDRRSRAVTLGDIARIMTAKGDVDQALELHREEMQTYEALGDRRSRAVTLGDIARIMTDKGDVDQALELHRQQVQIFEALGDRRERAVTLGDIARIMTAKGDVDQALELHREEMQTYEALGDRRSRAVTLGDIARIMTDKGDVDQALELHRERLQTYEALGDRRSRAVTLGDIARIMTAKGDVDQALELHRQQVQIFEALGDRRSRAVTLGDIARIMTAKGDVDQALELHREEMQTYEALGDRRSRAVTLGDIARIMTDKGDVDQALELQQQRLETNRALGDQDGIAAANFDIGQISLARAMEHNDAAAFQAAYTALAESYRLLLATGRLDGICAVGAALGQVLAMGGQREEAKTVLARSRDGFRKLGRPGEAAQMEALLSGLG